MLGWVPVGERAGAGSAGGTGAGLRGQVKAALARWVLHKRRELLEGGRGRPQAHDEATHAWDGRRRFAEDYTFAVVQADLGLLARLEWLPGRAAHRVWLMIHRDDGVWWIPPEATIVATAVADRWRVGGLALDCVQPLSRWTLRYSGKVHGAGAATDDVQHCEVNLEFVASADPFVPGVDDDPELVAQRLGEAHWDRELLRSVRRATQRGYVQVGDFRGTIALGSDVVPVAGCGVRQHTWGVRDWGAPQLAVQGLVVDGDSVVWIQRARFPAFTIEGGFVAERRAWQAVRSIREASTEADRCALEIETASGPRRWAVQPRNSTTMRVDGRGAIDVAFVTGAGGVRGLWATQSRTLPALPALR